MQPIITLTLSSRVISKKNSKRVMRSRFGKKTVVLPSVAYEQFCNEAIVELRNQLHYSTLVSGSKEAKTHELLPMPITGQIKVDTSFHIKGNYKVDADNLHTSILDVLMAAKIIADDSQVIAGSYTKTPGADDWMTIVRITIL